MYMYVYINVSSEGYINAKVFIRLQCNLSKEYYM